MMSELSGVLRARLQAVQQHQPKRRKTLCGICPKEQIHSVACPSYKGMIQSLHWTTTLDDGIVGSPEIVRCLYRGMQYSLPDTKK